MGFPRTPKVPILPKLNLNLPRSGLTQSTNQPKLNPNLSGLNPNLPMLNPTTKPPRIQHKPTQTQHKPLSPGRFGLSLCCVGFWLRFGWVLVGFWLGFGWVGVSLG